MINPTKETQYNKIANGRKSKYQLPHFITTSFSLSLKKYTCFTAYKKHTKVSAKTCLQLSEKRSKGGPAGYRVALLNVEKSRIQDQRQREGMYSTMKLQRTYENHGLSA